MPDTYPCSVEEAFAAVKPDHELLAIGRDRPRSDCEYRAVDVLCRRDREPHPFVVWTLVMPDRNVLGHDDYCVTGYYTDTLEDAMVELERRR